MCPFTGSTGHWLSPLDKLHTVVFTAAAVQDKKNKTLQLCFSTFCCDFSSSCLLWAGRKKARRWSLYSRHTGSITAATSPLRTLIRVREKNRDVNRLIVYLTLFRSSMVLLGRSFVACSVSLSPCVRQPGDETGRTLQDCSGLRFPLNSAESRESCWEPASHSCTLQTEPPPHAAHTARKNPPLHIIGFPNWGSGTPGRPHRRLHQK